MPLDEVRSPDAPHVFVVQGDITHLACDAWMLPTSQYLGVRRWYGAVPDLQARVGRTDTAAFERGTVLAVELAGGQLDEPRPVLTAVPSRHFRDAVELEPATKEFLQVAAAIAHRDLSSTSRRTRSLPLVALPFFGTRGGGGGALKGQVLTVLLRTAAREAAELGVDVALVLQGEASYALAQHIRAEQPGAWRALPSALEASARDLSEDARSGRLVPFMGAGVSTTAGGPLWAELIERLSRKVGLDEAKVAAVLEPSRDTLDQAAILRAAFEGSGRDGSFNELVAQEARLPRYGLAPALLSRLPANEAITLNYDTLFESAAADASLPRRVIPADPEGEESDHDERWLLKLHGSMTDPATIVLTREDYLGFNEDRAALTSLVKAMLMTRHLLFVGFGFADDHFHEILFDVRRAVRSQGAAELQATVVKLRADPLDDLLSKGDLRPLVIDPTGQRDMAAKARTLVARFRNS